MSSSSIPTQGPSATYQSPCTPSPVVISNSVGLDVLQTQSCYKSQQQQNENADFEAEQDRNVATEPPVGTPLGDLRRQVVDLQAQINGFLTDKLATQS